VALIEEEPHESRPVARNAASTSETVGNSLHPKGQAASATVPGLGQQDHRNGGMAFALVETHCLEAATGRGRVTTPLDSTNGRFAPPLGWQRVLSDNRPRAGRWRREAGRDSVRALASMVLVSALLCAACGDGATKPTPAAPTICLYAQPVDSTASGRASVYWRWTSSEDTNVTTTLALTPGSSVKRDKGFGRAVSKETSFEGLRSCTPYTIEITAQADTGAQAVGVVVVSTRC